MSTGQKQFQIRMAILVGVITALLVLLFCWVLSAWHTATNYLNATDANRQELVARMVIDYVETNEFKWPRGWTELHQSYDAVNGSETYCISFEDLKKTVEIDWTFNPDDVLQGSLPQNETTSMKLIWLANGRKSAWKGSDPNAMVIQYLRKKADQTQNEWRLRQEHRNGDRSSN